MPRQIYPGQLKFRTQYEEERLAKQRADARLRMAKLRQKKYNEQTSKLNKLQDNTY